MSRNKHCKTVLSEILNHDLKVLLSLSLEQAIGNTDGGFEAKKEATMCKRVPKCKDY